MRGLKGLKPHSSLSSPARIKISQKHPGTEIKYGIFFCFSDTAICFRREAYSSGL